MYQVQTGTCKPYDTTNHWASVQEHPSLNIDLDIRITLEPDCKFGPHYRVSSDRQRIGIVRFEDKPIHRLGECLPTKFPGRGGRLR
jgi:hypothetical protein